MWETLPSDDSTGGKGEMGYMLGNATLEILLWPGHRTNAEVFNAASATLISRYGQVLPCGLHRGLCRVSRIGRGKPPERERTWLGVDPSRDQLKGKATSLAGGADTEVKSRSTDACEEVRGAVSLGFFKANEILVLDYPCATR